MVLPSEEAEVVERHLIHSDRKGEYWMPLVHVDDDHIVLEHNRVGHSFDSTVVIEQKDLNAVAAVVHALWYR